MGGTGVTNANGSPTSVDLSGAGTKSLLRTLNNKNTASYPGGAAGLFIGSGGVFHNLSTGTFNGQSANGISFTIGGTAAFTNDGVFNSAVTTGDTDFNINSPVDIRRAGRRERT